MNSSFACKRHTIPDGVEDTAILLDTQQLVGLCDGMYVRLFTVVEESIGLPDAFQHFNAETECFDGSVETQTPVLPRLAKVAVH